MKKIVYQGVAGAFSHITAKNLFGEKNEFVGKHTFKDMFADVVDGKADLGVVPIENTLAGSVYENYDLLERNDVYVIGEAKTKIEHHLLVLPGTKLSDVTRVFSHPKALEQCEKFFEAHPNIEEVIHADTAGAAKFVAECRNPNFAAIASSEAAELYGLEILKRNIEDSPHNWTRFVVISKKPDYPADPDKASIMFSVSHKPGSLFRALKVIADNNLNMSKLQSRPIEGRPFAYFFYVDIEFEGKSLTEAKKILEDLKPHTHFLKILGFYKKDHLD